MLIKMMLRNTSAKEFSSRCAESAHTVWSSSSHGDTKIKYLSTRKNSYAAKSLDAVSEKYSHLLERHLFGLIAFCDRKSPLS